MPVPVAAARKETGFSNVSVQETTRHADGVSGNATNLAPPERRTKTLPGADDEAMTRRAGTPAAHPVFCPVTLIDPAIAERTESVLTNLQYTTRKKSAIGKRQAHGAGTTDVFL